MTPRGPDQDPRLLKDPPNFPACSAPLPQVSQRPRIQTWVLLFRHDGVAEREEAEKLVRVAVAQLDGVQEACVPEGEHGVGQGVEGEVYRLRLLEDRGGGRENGYDATTEGLASLWSLDVLGLQLPLIPASKASSEGFWGVL